MNVEPLRWWGDVDGNKSLFVRFHLGFLCVCMPSRFSCVQHFATLWTVARQAPLSMGFSRQEHWSGLPRPPPGDLPDPGTKPSSLMSSVLAGGFFTSSATWVANKVFYRILITVVIAYGEGCWIHDLQRRSSF